MIVFYDWFDINENFMINRYTSDSPPTLMLLICSSELWLFRLFAGSPPGLFAPWLVCLLVCSPPGWSPRWIYRWFIIEACVSIYFYRKATSKCSITSL